MKTIAVFGASGVTGTHFIDKAIAQGWKVQCLSRSALKEKSGQTVVIGQAMNAHDVKKTLVDSNEKPVDAVVVALGHNRTDKTNPWSAPTSPTNLLETAVGHIINEMKVLGIKRLVYVSAYGIGNEWSKLPLLVRILVRYSNIMIAYRDHEKAERLLESDPFIDFTILQPPMLTNALKPTQARLLKEREPISSFMKCTRISLAWFVFDMIDQNQQLRKKMVLLN
jgi:putative NADH-flavin reductase